LVRELVHELQTELAGSGDHDGGSGDLLAVARLSGAQTRLNQKDLKSATIQTAPVMRKVKPGEKARGASPDGRALIGLCQCVGMGQNVFPVHLVVEQVETVVRLFLRLLVQLPLKNSSKWPPEFPGNDVFSADSVFRRSETCNNALTRLHVPRRLSTKLCTISTTP
jgi:hypothetical protein